MLKTEKEKEDVFSKKLQKDKSKEDESKEDETKDDETNDDETNEEKSKEDKKKEDEKKKRNMDTGDSYYWRCYKINFSFYGKEN